MKKDAHIDTGYFKKKLEKELKTLEGELTSLGHKNPDNPSDWEPSSKDTEASDLADSADNIENFELNTALIKPLEIQYNDVKRALDKIKNGTYGFCEVDGKPIEKERLEANPAARTRLANKEIRLN